MASGNPFTPSFGVSPPLLVGREGAVGAFAEALEEGLGSPYRATLITGQRGSGKTVLLNALEDEARRRGWVVASETTRPGVAAELAGSTLPALLRQFPGAYDSFFNGAGASVAGVGLNVSRQRVDNFPVQPSLRHTLTTLADAADQAGGGVLITLDEVGRDGLADLQIIAQVVQHTFREGRQVVFAAAGLPSHIQGLLQSPGTTFLRRAERLHLGPVSLTDVARAISEPMAAAGRRIDGEALSVATAGTRGYPFMIQMIGFQLWRASEDGQPVTADQARSAIEAAGRRVGQLVHEPALAELSSVDRTFLAAMAVDDQPSKMSDIRDRLGVDGNYASQYRLRLIQAELIYAPSYGRVDFLLPHLREYLREHASHDVLSPRTSGSDRLAASQARHPGGHPGPAGSSAVWTP